MDFIRCSSKRNFWIWLLMERGELRQNNFGNLFQKLHRTQTAGDEPKNLIYFLGGMLLTAPGGPS